MSTLVTGRWFSPDVPVSSTNKTCRNDIVEIVLKVELQLCDKSISRLRRHAKLSDCRLLMLEKL